MPARKRIVAASPAGMSLRTFITAGFAQVPDESGRLVPFRPHPAQWQFTDAIDRLDANGLRFYLLFVLSTPKKFGKSTFLAVIALWALVADPLGGIDREVPIIASDLEQTQSVVFAIARKMIERHPYLSTRCRILSREIIYTETIDDGGRTYTSTSLLAAKSKDAPGGHGGNASCVIGDEIHTQDDYELLEAYAPSPARRSPMTVLASYAGLRSQQKAGTPWYDLTTKGRAGTDPKMFFLERRGDDAYQGVPWYTERWRESMVQLYSSVPSKYARLVRNEVASSESAFLALAEREDATDPTLTEPVAGLPGVLHSGGLDIGLKHDATGYVVGHVDRAGRFVVDVVRQWKGTRSAPVNLDHVEAEVIAIARRFRLSALTVDQWMAHQLVGHLQRAGLPARAITLAPATLDKLTTVLKSAFVQRAVRIPATARALLSELEDLEAVEMGARNRRRDLVRFNTPAGDHDAHDDLAIALALALMGVRQQLGRVAMAEITECAQAHAVHSCPLLGVQCELPPWPGAGCGGCAAYVSVRDAVVKHLAETGESLSIHEACKRDLVSPNTFIGDMKLRTAIRTYF